MVLCRKKRESSDHGVTRTWMSSFILFLIKYCLLPISIENDEIIFKAFSWKTFIHCCGSFGYMILFFALTLILTSSNPEKFYKVDSSFAINFSITLIGLSNMSGLLIPLIISDGLTSLNTTFITYENLRVPTKGYRIIIGESKSLILMSSLLCILYILDRLMKPCCSNVLDDDWIYMFRNFEKHET